MQALVGWTCESIRPGSTVLPARSSNFVRGPRVWRTSRLVPTRRMRPSLIARASRIENFGSTVTILPWCRIKSASAAGDRLTASNTARAVTSAVIRMLIARSLRRDQLAGGPGILPRTEKTGKGLDRDRRPRRDPVLRWWTEKLIGRREPIQSIANGGGHEAFVPAGVPMSRSGLRRRRRQRTVGRILERRERRQHEDAARKDRPAGSAGSVGPIQNLRVNRFCLVRACKQARKRANSSTLTRDAMDTPHGRERLRAQSAQQAPLLFDLLGGQNAE